MRWEDLLKSAWPRARARHLYPELPPPTMADIDESVAMDVRAKHIQLSEAFAESVSEAVPAEVVAQKVRTYLKQSRTVLTFSIDAYCALLKFDECVVGQVIITDLHTIRIRCVGL